MPEQVYSDRSAIGEIIAQFRGAIVGEVAAACTVWAMTALDWAMARFGREAGGQVPNLRGRPPRRGRGEEPAAGGTDRSSAGGRGGRHGRAATGRHAVCRISLDVPTDSYGWLAGWLAGPRAGHLRNCRALGDWIDQVQPPTEMCRLRFEKERMRRYQGALLY